MMIAFDDPNLIPASSQKPDIIPDEIVMLLVYATVAPSRSFIQRCEAADIDWHAQAISAWRHILESASPLLYARLVEAAIVEYRRVVEIATQQNVPIDEIKREDLEDRLEYNPQFLEAFENATVQAIQLTESELGIESALDNQIPLGYIHEVWVTQQQILRKQYGIEWLTPAQMNPLSRYS